MTGFADEASANPDVQIAVTKELGWNNIESRTIAAPSGNKNIASLTDAEFDVFAGKLADAGVRVNCYGSGIANWSKPITEAPDPSYAELENAIPRLAKLGTKMVRVMSFAVPKEIVPVSWDYADEVVKRMKHLTRLAEDAGLTLVHENCKNWGGLSFEHTLYLMDKINSPAFKLVFDTGNPVFNDDVRGEAPYPRQSAWEFYSHVREFVAYVHIKDGFVRDDGEQVFTFAGEGNGEVARVLEDLIVRGYDGGFSIEPHMGKVFHNSSVMNTEEMCRKNYLEYGKRCENMLRGFVKKYRA